MKLNKTFAYLLIALQLILVPAVAKAEDLKNMPLEFYRFKENLKQSILQEYSFIPSQLSSLSEEDLLMYTKYLETQDKEILTSNSDAINRINSMRQLIDNNQEALYALNQFLIEELDQAHVSAIERLPKILTLGLLTLSAQESKNINIARLFLSTEQLAKPAVSKAVYRGRVLVGTAALAGFVYQVWKIGGDSKHNSLNSQIKYARKKLEESQDALLTQLAQRAYLQQKAYLSN